MVRTELGWLLSHPHHGWLICISRNWDCAILKNYNWVIFLQCSHDKNSMVKYCLSFVCSHNNVFITFVIAMLCMVLRCKIFVRVITRLTTNWGQNILMSGNRVFTGTAGFNALRPSDTIWRQIWVNIGSGNGLMPDSTKPLPEPMLTDHQWSPLTFILGQFNKGCLNHQSLTVIWKLHV